MYPEIVQIKEDEKIELIQNTGIQFIDYDLIVDWGAEDSKSDVSLLRTCLFEPVKGKNLPVRLFATESKNGKFFNPLQGAGEEKGSGDVSDYKESKVSLLHSLELYEGVWFPVPYARLNKPENNCPSNWVRARFVRVTDEDAINDCKKRNSQYKNFDTDKVAYEPSLGERGDYDYSFDEDCRTENPVYYRVVFAFDTETEQSEEVGYFCPDVKDIQSGQPFKFAYRADVYGNFLEAQNQDTAKTGRSWIHEWANGVFDRLYKERIKGNVTAENMQEMRRNQVPLLHYLNVLAFLGLMVKPNQVIIRSNPVGCATSQKNKNIGVSLILDIGNSRSCGVLVEENTDSTLRDDDFSNTYPLFIRDLNAAERGYTGPFSSRIEFAEADFDSFGASPLSGRSDAFEWRSLVRVGREAEILSLCSESSEGMSGMSSPKRYIWDTDQKKNDCWVFNSHSYQFHQVNSSHSAGDNRGKKANLPCISSGFNSAGEALFAINETNKVNDSMDCKYSNHSIMTFMLIEIILHAIVQMNSFSQRKNASQTYSLPRYLKSVILTTPPGMCAEERELYKGCVYEAVGVLWKALKYDTSDARTFKTSMMLRDEAEEHKKEQDVFVCPDYPVIKMGWNEAEAGQVVYLFNETQKVYQGDCSAFISSLRRSVTGDRVGESKEVSEGKLVSARVATLDIGGGTTDLVIKDYSYDPSLPDNAQRIRTSDIYTDGFKIAGDDILYDIIRNCIVPRIYEKLAAVDGIDPVKPMEELVQDDNKASSRIKRARFTQQILVRLAYKILFHIEQLDPEAVSVEVSGTVRDYLLDNEKNTTLPSNIKRMGPFELPSVDVIDFVNGVIGEYIEDFSILDMHMTFDAAKINRAILNDAGRFDIGRTLNKLAEVISTFNVDVLMLTGRSSRIPAIRSFFLQNLNVPSSRIITMHNYVCDEWYPFKNSGGVIGDAKTTASVGALISYMRMSMSKFPGFRFNLDDSTAVNNAHYIGTMTEDNRIKNESLLYKYDSSEMNARSNSADGKKKSSFVRVTDEGNKEKVKNDFPLVLPAVLGTRVLDDESVSASPLFKIDYVKTPDEVEIVKKASAISIDLHKLAPSADFKIMESYVNDLLDKLDPEVVENYRSRIGECLKKAAPAESSASSASSKSFNREDVFNKKLEDLKEHKRNELKKKNPLKSKKNDEGWAARLKSKFISKDDGHDDEEKLKNYIEAELNKEIPELVKQANEYADDEAKKHDNGPVTNIAIKEARRDLKKALNEAIDAHVERKTRKYERIIDDFKSGHTQWSVSAEIKSSIENSPYPLRFIREVEKSRGHDGSLVETFDLVSVKAKGSDISDDDLRAIIKMKLNTSYNSDVHFTDSGIIEIKGINSGSKL